MKDDTCQEAIAKLMAKDLAAWNGLPASCTIETLAPAELGEDEDTVTLGDDGVEAIARRAKATAYSEVMKVYLRDGAIARISIELPELPDPPALLAKLGAPEAKLDAWAKTTPTIKREAEWVYASRGLALVLSGNQQNVMELVVFPRTTVDHYRQALRYVEAPRERE
jgi:hypothetical protein